MWGRYRIIKRFCISLDLTKKSRSSIYNIGVGLERQLAILPKHCRAFQRRSIALPPCIAVPQSYVILRRTL